MSTMLNLSINIRFTMSPPLSFDVPLFEISFDKYTEHITQDNKL